MVHDSLRQKRGGIRSAFVQAALILMTAGFLPFGSLSGLFRENESLRGAESGPEPIWKYVGEEKIADVWAGHPVSFSFLASNDAVYAAFYDETRAMTAARRPLDGGVWEQKKLPTSVGWDSHNYIVMTFDSGGFLHISGNMHCVPLIYFRAEKPDDIASLEPISKMTGKNEKAMTYPKFLTDPDGRLLFTYRDGSSGNGSQFWNVYDVAQKKWSRLIDKPMFDGEGKRNAYFVGPTKGPDGYFYMVWVWRDTPDCATNHDLCVARSRNLVEWETTGGEPVSLPIRFGQGESVDPVPPGGGLLNGYTYIGFDAEKRLVVSYSRYDENGCFQIWNARRNSDGWQRVQATDWKRVWKFIGGGCIPVDYTFSGITPDAAGNLTQRWTYRPEKKSGRLSLDRETLRPLADAKTADKNEAKKEVEKTPPRPEFDPKIAKEMDRIRHADPRMMIKKGTFETSGRRFVFVWETLPINRDRPAEGGAPEPSELRVFEFVKNAPPAIAAKSGK